MNKLNNLIKNCIDQSYISIADEKIEIRTSKEISFTIVEQYSETIIIEFKNIHEKQIIFSDIHKFKDTIIKCYQKYHEQTNKILNVNWTSDQYEKYSDKIKNLLNNEKVENLEIREIKDNTYNSIVYIVDRVNYQQWEIKFLNKVKNDFGYTTLMGSVFLQEGSPKRKAKEKRSLNIIIPALEIHKYAILNSIIKTETKSKQSDEDFYNEIINKKFDGNFGKILLNQKLDDKLDFSVEKKQQSIKI